MDNKKEDKAKKNRDKVEEYRKKYSGEEGHIWKKIDIAKRYDEKYILGRALEIIRKDKKIDIDSDEFFYKLVEDIFYIKEDEKINKEQMEEIMGMISTPVREASKILMKEKQETGDVVADWQIEEARWAQLKEQWRLDGTKDKEVRNNEENEFNLKKNDHGMIGEFGNKK